MVRKKNTPTPVVEKIEEIKEVAVVESTELFEDVVESKPEPVIVVEPVKVSVFNKLPGIGLSVSDYSKSVGEEEAVRLLQKVLGIAKTGTLDEVTIAAFLGSSGKNELIDDYNNMRKDGAKDLTNIRFDSKQALLK